MKKQNNKGFSLVELIVVVAIMAVLMGILVPTLIKYVQQSKRQKDLSGLEEVRSAMQEVLVSDEDYADIAGTITCTSPITIKSLSVSPTGTATGSEAAFIKDVADNVGDLTLGSKLFKGETVIFYLIDGKNVKCTLGGYLIDTIKAKDTTLGGTKYTGESSSTEAATTAATN